MADMTDEGLNRVVAVCEITGFLISMAAVDYATDGSIRKQAQAVWGSPRLRSARRRWAMILDSFRAGRETIAIAERIAMRNKLHG